MKRNWKTKIENLRIKYWYSTLIVVSALRSQELMQEPITNVN